MRHNDLFEWHPKKAEANRKKHKVTFDDAAAVLADDEGDLFDVEEYDDEYSTGEDRSITTGSHPDDRRIVRGSPGPIDRRTRGESPASSARGPRRHTRRRHAKEISGQ